MKVIGIAGGSGVGKSTICQALVDSDPEKFEVIHIDDYHRDRSEAGLPMSCGMINWDHPDIMRWDDLITDILRLQRGESFTVKTKDRHDNPTYRNNKKPIDRTLKPAPFLLVEGYLALYNPELRAFMDKTFYLDMKHADRMQRRDKGRLTGGDEYTEKILVPMHQKYVEPTKRNADEIIDVSRMRIDELRKKLLAELGY